MENIKTAIHTYAASAGKTCLPKGLLPLLPVLFLTMASLPVFPLFSVSAQALAQEEGMAARAQEENETSVHTQEEEAEDSAGRLWTEEYYRAVVPELYKHLFRFSYLLFFVLKLLLLLMLILLYIP